MPTLPVFHHREPKRFLRAPSIKILNQSVSISLCFMIISCATLTTLRNFICASSDEPSYIPASLSMLLMSAGYRQNLLTSEFEVWVMVKLWNKECMRRGGTFCLVCWAWKTPQPLVNFWETRNFLLENLCRRHNHISLNSALFSPSQKVNLLCNVMFYWPEYPYISYQDDLFLNVLSLFPMSVSCRSEPESSSWEMFP